jgi:type II secretory pathway pseudopilin PulG
MTSRRNLLHFANHRRASAMAIALVVLLVVGLMASFSLQAILRSHRQTRDEQDRLQAELLADSALSRAMAIIHDDPAWKGETWMIALSQIETEGETPEAGGTGVAIISSTPAETSDAVLLTVEAIYPNDPVHRARAERQLTLPISKR